MVQQFYSFAIIIILPSNAPVHMAQGIPGTSKYRNISLTQKVSKWLGPCKDIEVFILDKFICFSDLSILFFSFLSFNRSFLGTRMNSDYQDIKSYKNQISVEICVLI